MELLIILIGISIPIAVYFWRESRHNSPASRWPQLAEMVEFQFAPAPPRMGGNWKGRQISVTSIGEGQEAMVSTPLQCRTQIRFEIGPRQEVERAAGMVVPDRVSFNDRAFEDRYCVRATPSELGEMSVDPAMRQRLLQLPDVRVLGLSNKLDVRVPNPTEASDLRAYCDVAAALADAIDGN